MKKLNIIIAPGETPPAAELFIGLRAELTKLKKTVSGVSTVGIGLALLGFIGLQWVPAKSAISETVSGLAFVIGLFCFLIAHQYEKVLNQRLAEVSPIPDSLLAEAAAIGHASPAARDYLDGLRSQKREMTLAELNGLKKLLATTPPAAARKSMYG